MMDEDEYRVARELAEMEEEDLRERIAKLEKDTSTLRAIWKADLAEIDALRAELERISKSYAGIGRLQITRDQHGEIAIRVEDERSGVDFLELNLTAQAFGEAVTGLGNQPCTIELRGLHNVGRRYEHKSELVPFDRHQDNRDPEVQADALAPFEVDGWVGRRADLMNFHRYRSVNGEGRQQVHFGRYVEWVDDCEECGGTGTVDSGGFGSDDRAIDLPCPACVGGKGIRP